jgi:hypothetical protein
MLPLAHTLILCTAFCDIDIFASLSFFYLSCFSLRVRAVQLGLFSTGNTAYIWCWLVYYINPCTRPWVTMAAT